MNKISQPFVFQVKNFRPKKVFMQSRVDSGILVNYICDYACILWRLLIQFLLNRVSASEDFRLTFLNFLETVGYETICAYKCGRWLFNALKRDGSTSEFPLLRLNYWSNIVLIKTLLKVVSKSSLQSFPMKVLIFTESSCSAPDRSWCWVIFSHTCR